MALPNHLDNCLCATCKSPVHVQWYCQNCNKVLKVETQYVPRVEGHLRGPQRALQQKYNGSDPCPHCSVPKGTAGKNEITDKNRTADTGVPTVKDEGEKTTGNNKEEKTTVKGEDGKAGRRRIRSINVCTVQ